MKILSAQQIRELDQYTIKEEAITSIDLMERAALVFTNWFVSEYPNTEDIVVKIFCGKGNNGGDGLAVARLLYQRFYEVEVFCCQISKQGSTDFEANLKRLPNHNAIPIIDIENEDSFPSINKKDIIIDAIFGSGLNRSVEGYWAKLIAHINQESEEIVAIDIPSGTFADQHTNSVSINAHKTLSFELPKLAFLFPENQNRIGEWDYESIGLSTPFLKEASANNFYVDQSFILSILKTREKFSHKGSYGHALLIVGSYGKVGAAVLAAQACLRTGVGLLTVHVPQKANDILQISTPEAMVSLDKNQTHFSDINAISNYTAIGVGCGLGTHEDTVIAVKNLLSQSIKPMVLDADALNIVAQNKALLNDIPKGSILTPHPKEFERLFGKSANDFERNDLQRNKAKELGLYILLKGAHSCVACPDGTCYFNSTGNPGMATAGSGDVLTGIITSLLAQGNSPKDALVVGVYLHGLAGDLAALKQGQQALIASDIIAYLGSTFQKITK